MRRAALLLAAALIAGCGQTGELFLPSERPTSVPSSRGATPETGPSATEEASTEDNDEETPAR
ncbi:MAG: lipoprotein [Pseudomonadota bacterium]|mgnify:CR=1 FL=1